MSASAAETFLFLAAHAAMLLLILVTAIGAGTAVAGNRALDAPPWQSLSLRAALGLALSGQVFVLFGALGILSPIPTVVFCGLAIALGALRFDWTQVRLRWSVVLAAGVVLVPLFLLALHPPRLFDETCYHLPFTQAAARTGSLELLEDVRFGIFPQLHELLCVPLLLLSGEVATHLVSMAEFLILGGLLAGSVSRRSAALLGAAIVLGNPLLVQAATINYADLALTLFVVAAFCCLDRLTRGADGWPLALLAGFFLGTACSVKYLGGFFAAAGLAWIAAFAPRDRIRLLILALVGIALGAAPMYGVIVAKSGNPLFPYAESIFGGLHWTVAPPDDSWTRGGKLANFAWLFWDMTFARAYVNWQPPMTPFFAVSLGIVAVCARRNRRAACLLVIALAYLIAFAFLPRDSRYLLPLVPLLAVPAAGKLAAWMEDRARGRLLASAVAMLAALPLVLYPLYRMSMQGLPPVTEASRSAAVRRAIPALAALDHRGGGRIYGCVAEELRAFGEGRLVGDFFGPYAYRDVLGTARDSADLAAKFRSLHVTEFLVSARCPPQWRLARQPHFELVYRDAAAELWRVAR